MSEVAIVDAKPIHVGMIARRLRAEDCAEIRALYGDVRKAIRFCFHGSAYRKTAFVDGEIAAMWGCYGSFFAIEGKVWLVTSREVERVPMRFLREVRREVTQMLQSRQALLGHAAASYTKALRFMEMAGFTIGDTEPLGRNGEPYRPLRMET